MAELTCEPLMTALDVEATEPTAELEEPIDCPMLVAELDVLAELAVTELELIEADAALELLIAVLEAALVPTI